MRGVGITYCGGGSDRLRTAVGWGWGGVGVKVIGERGESIRSVIRCIPDGDVLFRGDRKQNVDTWDRLFRGALTQT